MIPGDRVVDRVSEAAGTFVEQMFGGTAIVRWDIADEDGPA